MIINAVIESKDGGTLVLDFPRSIYDVYEKLQSVGIRQSPHQITLSDEEGDDVRVKLYSEDEIFSIGRTISGVRTPCVCMLSISVFISSSSLTLNGCPAKGRNFSTGIATGFFIVFFILSTSFLVSCTGFFLQLVLLL